MEDTQDIRGNKVARECDEQLSNPLKRKRFNKDQPSCNAIHESKDRKIRAKWLSYKERRVDALALRADERRDKLR